MKNHWNSTLKRKYTGELGSGQLVTLGAATLKCPLQSACQPSLDCCRVVLALLGSSKPGRRNPPPAWSPALNRIAGGQLNNRYLKASHATLQWLLENTPEEDDPYSPQNAVGAGSSRDAWGNAAVDRWRGSRIRGPASTFMPSMLCYTLLALQRGSKRHPSAAAAPQAYTGAAVGRTATGQFAPAINASKRRRVDGSSGMGGGAAVGPAGDAEYPGLPAGMKRPSLQVGYPDTMLRHETVHCRQTALLLLVCV